MKLKFAPDLFLEVAELNRLQKSLDKEGFRKVLLQDSQKFGLIYNSTTDPDFDNGKVIRDVDNGSDKTIKVNELFGVDKSGEFLYSELQTQITVPNDSNWYWVKISHTFSVKEKGLFSIAANGNLVGSVDAELLTILRGQPNFPSRIKFLNSASNTQEYDILEVIDNQNAIVTGGPFTVESGLQIGVVGTFTQGITVPGGDKYPFQYDRVTLTLVQETSINQRPSYTSGTEFFLARIKRVGADVIIQDKRIEIYKTRDFDVLSKVSLQINPVIGVEAIRYDNSYTVRDRNVVDVSWSYKSSNFTITSSSNLLSLSSGAGGRYKSNAQFVDGDFDGWRVYTENGKYSTILSSVKQASNINLTLDVLDIDDYSSNGGTTWISQEVVVVPDCEEIEIRLTPDTAELQLEVTKLFPINSRLSKIPLVVNGVTSTYKLSYRYKTLNNYTGWTLPLNDESPFGFLAEASFDVDGVFVPLNETRDYVVGGEFVLNLSNDSYSKLFLHKDGLEYFQLDFASLNEVTELKVKEQLKYQVLGVSTLPVSSIVLPRNYYINLSDVNASNGSEFIINLYTYITFGNYSINIQENYVDSSNRGTTLFSLDKYWTGKTFDRTISLLCKYDGSSWYVMPIVSTVQIDSPQHSTFTRIQTNTLITSP